MFVLDHVIKNVAEDEDLKQMLKTKKDISDAKSEESSGVEVLTGNFRKTVEDFGEDVVPICPRYLLLPVGYYIQWVNIFTTPTLSAMLFKYLTVVCMR